MKILFYVSLFVTLILSSCKKEEEINLSLDNTRWEVSKMEYFYPNGQVEVYDKTNFGIFYWDFSNDGNVVIETSPYSTFTNATWKKTTTNKLIFVLNDLNGNEETIEYQILEQGKFTMKVESLSTNLESKNGVSTKSHFHFSKLK